MEHKLAYNARCARQSPCSICWDAVLSKFTSFILFLTFAVKCTHSGNILMPSIPAVITTPSHEMVLSTLTKGLVEGAHNVTLLTNDIKGTQGYPNGSYSQVVFFRATYDNSEINQLREYMQEIAFEPTDIAGRFRIMSTVLAAQFGNCQDLWKDESVLLKLKQTKFDLVIVFPFSACSVLLAHYLRVPFVVVVTTIRIPFFHEGFYGMPYPSSYVPFDIFGMLTDEMSFVERMENLIKSFFVVIVMDYILPSQYHEIQVQFDIQPAKSVKELYADASLILSHVSEGSDFPRPRTPNYIPIGGLIARPAESLPQDLDDFIQGSGDNGVIIFTLGSGVKGMRSDLVEVFARVFNKLSQRVLWRHQGKPPTYIGQNTKVAGWLPQNDILGHPKTRLLIYHGGSNGVAEAIYHGVPMVIIPLFADQYAHAARVQKKGMGLALEKTNITEESLMEVIQTVLNNSSFKERSLHYSRIHHDAPMTPLQRSIYWMEHVMKFGADHLRPRSVHMSSIELYMVDVTLLLILVGLIGLYIDYVILKTMYGCCCKRNISKSKRE